MARAQQDLQNFALRLEVEELYTEYAHVLDNFELEQWPQFFTDDCLYQIVSRENRERGLPLALMRCESKAMLTDRVVTIRQTQMFAPRALRHLVSSLRIAPATALEKSTTIPSPCQNRIRHSVEITSAAKTGACAASSRRIDGQPDQLSR